MSSNSLRWVKFGPDELSACENKSHANLNTVKVYNMLLVTTHLVYAFIFYFQRFQKNYLYRQIKLLGFNLCLSLLISVQNQLKISSLFNSK